METIIGDFCLRTTIGSIPRFPTKHQGVLVKGCKVALAMKGLGFRGF